MRHLALIALLLTTPVLADDFALRRATMCFDFASEDHGIGAEAEIAVTLAADGTPEVIEVLRYQPETERGRRLAQLAAKAVQACSPYPAGTSSGTIVLGPDVVFPVRINPAIVVPDKAAGSARR